MTERSWLSPASPAERPPRGQAWALLGVTGVVRRFDELLESTAGHPRVREWINAHPHRALMLSPQIPQLIAASEWFDGNRQSHRYLREISAPGVDTKFAERYRPELAAVLGVSSSSAGFLADLGLQATPALARLAVHPRIAVIIENEISYLSAAVPDDGVVLWGKGFEVDNIGRLPWLSGAEIVYWGDIDTHGFAILDRLRVWLPATRSVLMDRDTLLTHRDRWGTEDRPAQSALTRLTSEEHRLYTDLVEGGLGDRVRLEQERIDWGWAAQRLPAAG